MESANIDEAIDGADTGKPCSSSKCECNVTTAGPYESTGVQIVQCSGLNQADPHLLAPKRLSMTN